jgi:hypothetical protein
VPAPAADEGQGGATGVANPACRFDYPVACERAMAQP